MKIIDLKRTLEGLLACVLVISLSALVGLVLAVVAVLGFGCLYKLCSHKPVRPPPLPKPPKAIKSPPKIRNFATALDAVQNLSVQFFRRIARERGCAPTAGTSDQEIVEIMTSVSTAFSRAAEKRGERIAAPNLNFIILKFLQIYEQMGRQLYEAHLSYEINNYLCSGLRQDYRHELSVGGEEGGSEKTTVVVGLAGGFSGDNEITSQLFTPLIQEAIGAHRILKLVEIAYGDELLVASIRERFNLFIIFLNPCFEFSPSFPAASRVSDSEVLRRLKSLSGTPLIVVRSGAACVTVDNLREAGADAVFGMPFGFREVCDAVNACICRTCEVNRSERAGPVSGAA